MTIFTADHGNIHRAMIKLQTQNKHKTTHDRHLTGVHWPISRGRVWGSRGGRGGRASTGGAR